MIPLQTINCTTNGILSNACNNLPYWERHELQSRTNKKDKVEGEIHLAVHLKVDKSKLPDKLEVEKQYDALFVSTVSD